MVVALASVVVYAPVPLASARTREAPGGVLVRSPLGWLGVQETAGKIPLE